MANKKYAVNWALTHNKKTYEEGDSVSLSKEEAKSLIELGVIADSFDSKKAAAELAEAEKAEAEKAEAEKAEAEKAEAEKAEAEKAEAEKAEAEKAEAEKAEAEK